MKNNQLQQDQRPGDELRQLVAMELSTHETSWRSGDTAAFGAAIVTNKHL
jgi:hypothetical protein